MKVQIPFVHYLITRVLATNKVSPKRFLFLFPLNGSLIELLLNYLEVKHLDEVDQKKISTLCQGSKLFSEQGNNQSLGSRAAGFKTRQYTISPGQRVSGLSTRGAAASPEKTTVTRDDLRLAAETCSCLSEAG